MRTIDLLPAFVSTFINLLLAYPMFDSLWAKKQHKTVPGLLLLCSVVLFPICLWLSDGIALRLCCSLLPLLSLTLFFDAKAWQQILFCAVFFAVACVSRIMVALVSDACFTPGQTVPAYLLYHLQIVLLSKFFVYAFVAGVRIKQKCSSFRNTKKYYLLIPLFLLVSVAILVLQYYVFPDFPFEMQSLLIVVAICFTVLIVASILMFVFLDFWRESQIDKQQLDLANEIIERQINQYQALIEHHKDILKMRHDHKNFCIGMLSELEHGNTQTVMRKLQEECTLLQNTSKQSGDIIHTVLEIKTELAQKSGVTIDFVYRNQQHLSVSTIDLAVILGNALDNAIEATAALKKDATKTISVLVACKNNTIVASIKNPVPHKLDVTQLATQKNDTSHHGFGIISMRQLAAKYGGEVILDCTEDLFTASIVLNNLPPQTTPCVS